MLACEWQVPVPESTSTTLLTSFRALNRDTTQYPDPENYRPERWLEPDWPTYMAPLTRYPNLREGKGMHTFGWGRRQCLGQSIADYELFIIAASVAWGFTISTKKCPLTGETVAVDDRATNSSVILESLPFPMDFKPRSEERAKAIMKQYETIRGELRV